MREDGINAAIVLHTISAIRRRGGHLGGRACVKDNGERSGKSLPVFIAVHHEKTHNILAGTDQGQQGFDSLWDQSNVPGDDHYQ